MTAQGLGDLARVSRDHYMKEVDGYPVAVDGHTYPPSSGAENKDESENESVSVFAGCGSSRTGNDKSDDRMHKSDETLSTRQLIEQQLQCATSASTSTSSTSQCQWPHDLYFYWDAGLLTKYENKKNETKTKKKRSTDRDCLGFNVDMDRILYDAGV